MADRRGWGWPSNSRKAHYFIGNDALCGRWLFFGPVEEGNNESKDNCKGCQRLLAEKDAVTHG